MAMVKYPFNGQLNSNEIFSAVYNMIISQQIFADNIKDGFGLAGIFKVDGGLVGDTKLFYSTDVLRGADWGADGEAGNLLALDRPLGPKCQAITIDTFKQIRLTIDNYLTKRAWSDEGAFNSFNTVMLGWLNKTKDVADNTLINAHCGTHSSVAKTVALTASPTTIDAYRLRGLLIGKKVADLLIELKDYSRDYNGLGYLRNYNPDDFIIIWNANYANEIDDVSVPNIFHDPNIGKSLTKYILPARFFGTVGTSAVAAASVTENTYRTLIEADYVTATTSGSTVYHLFAGDYIPAGGKKLTAGTVVRNSGGTAWILSGAGTASSGIAAGEYYTTDATIVCKLVHKDAVKFMSGFMVATEFFNPRSLTENHYLTYGYGLDDLKEYPIITLSETNA